jgi:hypothetical protein
MEDLGPKDTAAHRVIRQMVDHTWGPDEKISDQDLVLICRSFRDRGGSWKGLMDGDISFVTMLEDAIDSLVNGRNLARMAVRLAARPCKR